MKRLMIAVTSMLAVACDRADAPTQPAAFTLALKSHALAMGASTIRVEALIDGRSRLILRRNTAQWYHLDFAAPGRWLGNEYPTTISGIQWGPVWSGFTGEVRCGGCFSDVFHGVSPALPATRTEITLTGVQARHAISVVQQPSAANDYTAIIEFDDNAPAGGDTYIVDIAFTPVNLPPVAVAPSLVVASCVAGAGSVVLDGSASHDPDGSVVAYEWAGAGTSTDAVATFSLPLGDNAFQLRVTDNDGEVGETSVIARVEDAEPPIIGLPMTRIEAWPPNHEMQLVASAVGANDACDSAPTVSVQVTSNESSNSAGDGNTAEDWIVERKADGTFDVYVRAERAGAGAGRIYTIAVSAIDASGNQAASSAIVRVPFNRAK